MLVTIVVALLLFVVLDRVAVRVVAAQIATRAQQTEHLPTRPAVSIGGTLFLPQVATGRYRDVNVEIRGLRQADVRIDRVRTHLDGVRIPLSTIVRGQVTRIPVDQLDADVELTFADMNAYLASQGSALRISKADAGSGSGSAILVQGTVSILGSDYPVSGTADIGVLPAAVTFQPRELSEGVAAVVPPALRQLALSLLTVRVPVDGLPFNLQLRSATVAPDRMRFSAAGHDVVLDTTTVPPAAAAASLPPATSAAPASSVSASAAVPAVVGAPGGSRG